MSIDVGMQLGNYRLLKVIGQGGFADVYLGEHVYLKTSAAIKVLRTHLSEEALQQFLTEARTIARLSHTHIVSVLDFGMEKHIPFLVMSYAPHGTLRERHPEGSVLPVAMIIAYLRQISQALQYAHERKIVHRDVKPENMLLADDNRVMLSDFGIAIVSQSMFSTPAHRLLNKPQALGTTTYMSPEQCSGSATYLSDQYALGVVIYEWLCGVPPFVGSDMDVVRQHLYDLPPLLSEKNPTIPSALERVVLRALEKEPERRFARVVDFAVAFEETSQQKTSGTQGSVPAVNKSGQLRLAHPLYTSETVSDLKPLEGQASYERSLSGRLAAIPPQTGVLPVRTANLRYQPDVYVDRPLTRRTVLAGLGALAFAGTMGAIAVAAWQNSTKKATVAPTPTPQPTSKPAETPTEAPPTATPTATPNPLIMAATRPAITAWGAGQLHLFVRGADNGLWYRPFNGSWQPWQKIADGVIYDPAVVSWSPGRFDLFVRGADNTLQHGWYDGTWHFWESLGGLLTADPAASSWGPNRLDVFARSIDNGLWHKSFDGSWHDWEPLSGGLSSGPSAASWGANRIDVYVRGTDNALWSRAFDGSWHEWASLGGSIASEPSVASWGPNHLDVFALGADNTMQHIGYEGQWYPWESLGGGLTSAPSVVSWGPGRVDVFARGEGSMVQQRAYENGWQNWTPLPS